MAFSKAADTMSLIGKPSLLAMILIFFNNSEETMVQKRSSLFARSFSFCFSLAVPCSTDFFITGGSGCGGVSCYSVGSFFDKPKKKASKLVLIKNFS